MRHGELGAYTFLVLDILIYFSTSAAYATHIHTYTKHRFNIDERAVSVDVLRHHPHTFYICDDSK